MEVEVEIGSKRNLAFNKMDDPKKTVMRVTRKGTSNRRKEEEKERSLKKSQHLDTRTAQGT